MTIKRTEILKRIQYGRRTRYGSFAPWEIDEDDPGQTEFQVNPEAEEKYSRSLPLEKRNSDYFLHDYLPEKFGLNHDQIVKMATRYMDHHKMVQGYRRFLKEDLSYNTPEVGSMHDLVKHHLANGFDCSNIIGCIGGHIDKIKHSEHLYDHLTNNARLFKITGKI